MKSMFRGIVGKSKEVLSWEDKLPSRRSPLENDDADQSPHIWDGFNDWYEGRSDWDYYVTTQKNYVVLNQNQVSPKQKQDWAKQHQVEPNGNKFSGKFPGQLQVKRQKNAFKTQVVQLLLPTTLD